MVKVEKKWLDPNMPSPIKRNIFFKVAYREITT